MGLVDRIEKRVEAGFGKINSAVFRRINTGTGKHWYEFPTLVGLLNLRAYRDDLRQGNLYDTRTETGSNGSSATNGNGVVPREELPDHRTYDGSFTDPTDPKMGAAGTRFGRNAPIDENKSEGPEERLDPNPRAISQKLFYRDEFIPATSLNVLAAAWIQFENHDWFGHGDNNPDKHIEVPVPEGDEWPEGEVMRFRETHPDRSYTEEEGQPRTYVNTVTHWWDGSQIYGSTEERNRKLRTGVDGKMTLEDGRLPEETKEGLAGIDLTGFSDNYWLGLSLLHTLFVREHNAICDYLKGHNPSWDDETLFLKARLVNAALQAKIHTVEWTPGILANPVLERAMHANWYGILPMWVREKFGHIGTEMIGGVVGSDQEHHSAPYSITEEFISVYRMHPLLPDDYVIRDATSDEQLGETDFDPIQGATTREMLSEYGVANWLYSFGIAHPGAITLKNHPRALMDHVRLNGERVDLGTLDILRDRERGVRRYNEFREALRMPRAESFTDITGPDQEELAAEMEEVYGGDIDKVDLQIGMLAEPLPPGFGFSDTAFRIFILMASRRLKSDRFYTNDYSPEVYTQAGIDWVENNTMSDVLLRHFPELGPALEGVENAFAPWNRVG
ncbi:MAG: peroxidase family protein [Solirubrobacterales bacterium]